MKRIMITVFIIINIIILSCCFYCCSDSKESEITSTMAEEAIKEHSLKIAPVQIKTHNIFRDGNNVLYHPYFAFDKNEITCWIGNLNDDKGRMGIFRFASIEREFDLSYIRIKTGIQGEESLRNDFSKPSKIELHFFKVSKEGTTNEKDEEQQIKLTHKIKLTLKDETEWQSFKVTNTKMNFDFVNIYVKDAFKGTKYPNNVVISEIEFIVEDKTKTLNTDKYDYLYDDLKKWYNNNGNDSFISKKTSKYQHQEYIFYSNLSSSDDVYRDIIKQNKSTVTSVPTFLDACNMINFGQIPKEQKQYFTELKEPGKSHLTFDSAFSQIMKDRSTSKSPETFFFYQKGPDFVIEKIKMLPLYFPFMDIIGDQFINPPLKRKFSDSSLLTGGDLKKFFKNNPKMTDLFIARTHNGQSNGTIKYLLYYSKENIESKKTITLDTTDPVCIFIFDEKGRLIKVIYRQYEDEEHYFIVWDGDDKVEKVLILEIGFFGLKRIKKALAKK